jgi:hypothetical protein
MQRKVLARRGLRFDPTRPLNAADKPDPPVFRCLNFAKTPSVEPPNRYADMGGGDRARARSLLAAAAAVVTPR